MTERMHNEITNFTPILEKIEKGGSLDWEETRVLEQMTEENVRKCFEWIQNEKQKSPQSELIQENGLYTRFMKSYQLAKEKNGTLKKTYTEGIKNQLDTLGIQVQVANTATIVEGKKQEAVLDTEKLKSLKASLEWEAKSPVTVEWLNTTLKKLREEKDPTTRAVTTSVVWSKLANAGYIVSVNQDGAINIESAPNLRQSATEIATTLAANVNAENLTIADIQRAMIVGPTSFHRYLKTQSADIAKVSTEGYMNFIMKTYEINLSGGKTPQQQIQIIQRSKATPEEKAVLTSYVNGGIKNYDITPEAKRQQEIDKIEAETKASPAGKAAEEAVNTASGGVAKAEQEKMRAAGEELTWNSFLDNPMQAVAKYPWTSLGIVLGSIWKFGFMKTLLGLVGGALGYKVIEEWGGIDAMKKDEKPAESEAPKKGARKKPKTSVDIPPAKSIDKTGMSGARLKATERVEKNQEIHALIEGVRESAIRNGGAEKGDIADYMTYINTTMQERKAGELINPSEFKFSIFSDENFLKAPGAVNLNNHLLKKILRVYLGAGLRTGPASDKIKKGEVEKNDFMGRNKQVLDDANKTLKDLVESIK